MYEQLDWDDLRFFLAIARNRTLSAAARVLGVQQPTMGRRLAALEARAGTRLLGRTPTGYVLTEAGEAVLGHVERIEAETQAISRQIAGHDIRLDGSLRLTTVETLAAFVLAPILAEFRDRHPLVELEIVANTRSLSLLKREADVALRVAPFRQADIVVRRMGRLGYGLYASQSYLDRNGTPDWTASADHSLITTEHDLMDTPEMVYLRALFPQARLALASNSRLVHRQAAAAGLGIACLARYLGDTAGLVRLQPSNPPPARDLWLGLHADLRHTPRIRAFTTLLATGLAAASTVLSPPAEGSASSGAGG